MNNPILPAVRLQLVGDHDCTLHDAVDIAADPHHPSPYFHHHLTALYPTLLPRFSRSLSMPPPSHLSFFRRPPRNPDLSPPASPPLSSCHEISRELADSLQSVIQTVIHISPQQVLDPAKEQFSACTLAVPTPCMSAMLTIMKNLSYISANMAALCTPPDAKIPHAAHVDFDVGELLQGIGDSLGAAAAQAGADLVLYHGDVGLKHVWVRGDEEGLSYALAHTIRRVLNTAQPGDTIEIGLLTSNVQSDMSQEHLVSSSPQPETDSLTQVTFVVSHKFSAVDLDKEPTHPKPCHSAPVLQRVLRHIGATLVCDLPPPPNFANGRTCELRVALARAKSNPPAPARPESDADIVAPEPSLEQLTAFIETLKNKRVALYASSKGSFARHVTIYLTAWGMDVSHISPEGNVEGFIMTTDVSKKSESQEAAEIPTKEDPLDQASTRTRFIIIDDDVDTLKERLFALRNDPDPCGMQRPSLANIHRPQSSPPISRTLPVHLPAPSSVVVLHFSSLSNYKAAKDMLQTVIASYTKLNIPPPEVMIIPKPAGPRRLLTALHTALTKPVIDPLFLPIATSPQSPGIFAHGTFFGTYASESTHPLHRPSKSALLRPNGGRSNTDKSSRSSISSDHSPLHPTSPLGGPDSVEYFSRAAYRLGGSPSSGLVIQSPDGQPAGIFFHPRVKGLSRMPSTQLMERDKGQLAIHERRQSVGRLTPHQNDRHTSSLASQAITPPPVPTVRASSTTGVPAPPHVKPIARSQSGPGPEQASTSTAPAEVQSPAPVTAPKSDTVQIIVQAASSPSTASPRAAPTRRSVLRRRTADPGSISATPVTTPSPPAKPSRKKKTKAPENIIVPPISVLIVDDNSINQTILSTFMKKKKIQYDIASNGREAVEKWKTGVFHLILMDIQMPVMDGIEATKEIRRMEKSAAQALYPTTPTMLGDPKISPVKTPSELLSPESRVPQSPYHPSVIIVALTASSLQSDRVAALGAGCNDFLTKPVSLLWLNSKIIEWGSIKALQMWADLRPSVMRSITHGQQAQARSIAERLHVPTNRRNAQLPRVPTATPASATQPTNQGQNVVGQNRSEIQSGNSSSETTRQDKANVACGAGNGQDSETPKTSSRSTATSINPGSEADSRSCESREKTNGSINKSPEVSHRNSTSPNGHAANESTDY